AAVRDEPDGAVNDRAVDAGGAGVDGAAIQVEGGGGRDDDRLGVERFPPGADGVVRVVHELKGGEGGQVQGAVGEVALVAGARDAKIAAHHLQQVVGDPVVEKERPSA